MCSMYNKKRWFIKGFFFVVVFLGVISLVLMLLWNWLMPAIFGVTSITYLQAIGLLILSKILCSGIAKRGWHHPYSRDHNWRAKFEERFEKYHEDKAKEEGV